MNHRLGAAMATITFALSFTMVEAVFAAHPLITDDTGTQGRGKRQFEFIAEYGVDRDGGIKTKSWELPTVPVFSYGASETTDIVFGLPYLSEKAEEAGNAGAVRGIGDASVELKARFYDKDGLSFAVKPGVSLPTGDEEKGLGLGKTSFSTFLITTKVMEAWAFHFNAGYIRNEYRLQADEDANRKDLWHVSLAAQVEVLNDLNLVANIGMERNPDKSSDTHPAFVLGGLIYSVNEDLDIDLGLKAGLNETETDYSILAGITWRL